MPTPFAAPRSLGRTAANFMRRFELLPARRGAGKEDGYGGVLADGGFEQHDQKFHRATLSSPNAFPVMPAHAPLWIVELRMKTAMLCILPKAPHAQPSISIQPPLGLAAGSLLRTSRMDAVLQRTGNSCVVYLDLPLLRGRFRGPFAACEEERLKRELDYVVGPSRPRGHWIKHNAMFPQ